MSVYSTFFSASPLAAAASCSLADPLHGNVGLTSWVSDSDIHQALLSIDDQLEVRTRMISLPTEISRLFDSQTTSMESGHIEGIHCEMVPYCYVLPFCALLSHTD